MLSKISKGILPEKQRANFRMEKRVVFEEKGSNLPRLPTHTFSIVYAKLILFGNADEKLMNKFLFFYLL